MERCHLLTNVIENIEKQSNYYATVLIPFSVKETVYNQTGNFLGTVHTEYFQVRLTTTAPVSSAPSSTVTQVTLYRHNGWLQKSPQTLLPPVSDPSDPSMSNKDPAPPSSSGPTRPSPSGPTPNPRNGVYTCGDSSSGVCLLLVSLQQMTTLVQLCEHACTQASFHK